MGGTENIALKIIKRADNYLFSISKAFTVLAGLVLLGATVMVCIGIAVRTFTDWTILFVEEWTALSLLPMSYLVFANGLRIDRHLKMDLVAQAVPKPVKEIFKIFSGVFGLVVTLFILRSSYNTFMYTWIRKVASSGPMRTPLWMFNIIIMIGIFFLAVDMLMFLLNHIIYVVTGKAELKFDDLKDEKEDTTIVAGIEGGETCR